MNFIEFFIIIRYNSILRKEKVKYEKLYKT